MKSPDLYNKSLSEQWPVRLSRSGVTTVDAQQPVHPRYRVWQSTGPGFLDLCARKLGRDESTLEKERETATGRKTPHAEPSRSHPIPGIKTPIVCFPPPAPHMHAAAFSTPDPRRRSLRSQVLPLVAALGLLRRPLPDPPFDGFLVKKKLSVRQHPRPVSVTNRSTPFSMGQYDRGSFHRSSQLDGPVPSLGYRPRLVCPPRSSLRRGHLHSSMQTKRFRTLRPLGAH